MKQRQAIVIVAVLLLAAVLICSPKGSGEPDLFHLEVQTSEGMERIVPWRNAQEEFYIFLPSYADLANTKLFLHTGNPVIIGGDVLTDGMSCEDILLDTSYVLEYETYGTQHRSSVVFVRSANLNAVHIETQSGRMEYIHQAKGNKESGQISVYQNNGELEYAGALESIRGRGNYTWLNHEKKPYNLTLSVQADLLGLGAAQEWVLLANAEDPSHMRNKLVCDFADKFGLRYTSDSRWVDLYLNGEYAGLYLLCERNEVHPQRVSVEQGDGFLVSLEPQDRTEQQGNPFVSTEAGQTLRIHHSGQDAEQLQQTWQSVEHALLAEDGIDPVTGKYWTELIDLDSWARKYLVEEVFGNFDGCYISQYFYRGATRGDDRIFAGPVWDFDLSMGNRACWALNDPQSFCANRLVVTQQTQAPWFYELYRKPEFYHYVTNLYSEEFLPLLERMVAVVQTTHIPGIQQAAELNSVRWEQGSAAEEWAYITDYLSRRCDFFDRLWNRHEPFYIVEMSSQIGGYYAYNAVSPGGRLPSIPDFEGTTEKQFTGWYYSHTNAPFDPDRPITEDIAIYAKWEDSPSKQLGQIGKLVPLTVISLLGVVMLLIEVRRMKKNG